MDRIRIGTRGSKLALKQAALVREALSRAYGGMETELVILRTRGDNIQDRPLSAIGDKGVFASELEQALLAGRIDLAVHSAKDLPVKLAEGLAIAAVLQRADVRDVLVVPKGGRTPVLRHGEITGDDGRIFSLGTGSRRRQFLAGKVWENVVCREIRGNVDTRLKKLREGGAAETYDGIVLAKAGLDRLGSNPEWESAFDFYPLPTELFLPAACQGMIAVEAVEGTETAEICKKITDEETALCFDAEREALAQLSADCSEAAAAWCRTVRDGQSLEMAGESAGRNTEETYKEGRLLLDVMYADRQVRLTGLVSLEEGRRLARLAARLIRGTEE